MRVEGDLGLLTHVLALSLNFPFYKAWIRW